MNDLNRVLEHLLKSFLLATRYGLIALFISGGVGVGCRKWPLIKHTAPPAKTSPGLDIHSMALGWIARTTHRNRPQPDATRDLPWRSDQIGERINVNPAQYERHTAHGDVNWCLAQWRAMNGQEATA